MLNRHLQVLLDETNVLHRSSQSHLASTHTTAPGRSDALDPSFQKP